MARGMIALLLAASASRAMAEHRTRLDFAWKFSLGTTHLPEQDLCPATSWSTDLDGFYCETWGHQAAYQLTEDECRLYCCGDPACAGYSFGKGFCVVGSNLTACQKDASKGFRGKGRATPAPMVAPTGFEQISFDDTAWDTINVPHDFVVTVAPSAQAEKNHGYRFKNVSYYRKHFIVPEEARGHSVWLDFDGVYRSSDFWLNGHFIGHHASGYTPVSFRVDTVKGLKYGGEDNVLAIRVDPRANEGWWYEGGGVYRHVWLRTAAATHGKNLYVAPSVTGLITHDRDSGLRADAAVSVEVTAENHGSSAATDVAVTFTIAKHGGSSPLPLWNVTTEAKTVPAGGTMVFKAVAHLRQMDLWDVDSPTLYVAEASVSGDKVSARFGVRKTEFDPENGFFLNGRHVKVKGMCNHQDFTGVGVAVPDTISVYRIRMLKSFGVNAWRMSHNPPNPELLDAADELGMLVWDENRMFGDHSTWYDDMRTMMLRDRNHPSIIWWSLCNEYGCTQLSANATLAAGRRFRALIKELDATRPISGAWNGDMTLGRQWGEQVCDMMGINYNYGAFAPYHASQPQTPLISSESCSCTSDRTYQVDNSAALIGAYHAWSCIRDCWGIIANSSYIQGSFDWTGFDYRGEETPTSWPAINSHFGVLDLAGFMKDDAFYYKAWFNTSAPLVHITPPNWNYNSTKTSPVARVIGCSGSTDIQRWKIDLNAASSGGWSKIESVHSPGKCLQFSVEGIASYPIKTAACSSTVEASSLLFSFDNATGRIMPKGHEGKVCMDVNGDNSGSVGFWSCADPPGSPAGNQKFEYTGDSVLRSLDSALPGTCVTYVDGTAVQVWAYTNGDAVELLLNGRSLGVQAVPAFEKATFVVPFEAGELTAVARKAGKPWATDATRTAGAPAAIVLAIDDLMAGVPIVANGQDAILITANLVDAHGTVVRHLRPSLSFAVTGSAQLIGLGNGDPSDHEDDKGSVRSVFNGMVRAVVQAGSTPGKVTVTATSPGLTPGSVSFYAK